MRLATYFAIVKFVPPYIATAPISTSPVRFGIAFHRISLRVQSLSETIMFLALERSGNDPHLSPRRLRARPIPCSGLSAGGYHTEDIPMSEETDPTISIPNFGIGDLR